jgi:acetylxylan esterase
MQLLKGLSACLAFTCASASALKSRAGSFVQVTNFGSNPSNTLMYNYVPIKLATKPGIIVAIHYCGGTAEEYYQGTTYSQLAEQYGFIVIYPQSPYSGTCWDVSSTSALTHNGGGDSNSIANMVTYIINTYGADPTKVFVTGTSSGAMMTNVMAATYPEMFAAATVYSGVPAGCFVSSTNQVNGWNTSCALGQIDDTQQQWTNVVHNMYPGYTGARPKMQIYHGSADTTLYPPNYNETIKEWTGVFGYSLTNPTVTNNFPQPNYYTYTYGPDVVGIYAIGVGHTVPVQEAQDMIWFGFSGTTTTPVGTPTPAPTTVPITAPAPTSTPAPGNPGTVAEWGQCGGIGWSGGTACVSPFTCQVLNAYYSQCLS